MLKELIATLWDTILYGDLRGHLRVLLYVILGEVRPNSVMIVKITPDVSAAEVE